MFTVSASIAPVRSSSIARDKIRDFFASVPDLKGEDSGTVLVPVDTTSVISPRITNMEVLLVTSNQKINIIINSTHKIRCNAGGIVTLINTNVGSLSFENLDSSLAEVYWYGAATEDQTAFA